MSNIYSVAVTAMDTATIDGLQNVVVVVYWQITGTDGVNFAVFNGSNVVGGPNPSDFIDYIDLTPDVVLSWCPNPLESFYKNSYTSVIDQQLTLKANSPVPTPLPWS